MDSRKSHIYPVQNACSGKTEESLSFDHWIIIRLTENSTPTQDPLFMANQTMQKNL